jgi:hypothetical protein
LQSVQRPAEAGATEGRAAEFTVSGFASWYFRVTRKTLRTVELSIAGIAMNPRRANKTRRQPADSIVALSGRDMNAAPKRLALHEEERRESGG